jgi:spore coat polysaccharide biosynthesis protein SpsF
MKFGAEVLQRKLVIETKTGIVLLARMSSSRLPAKALRKIEGKESILYIIEKLLSVVPKEKIILATSTEKSDDSLVEFVETLGISVFRGALNNVAERFYQAGLKLETQFICRMNGDNIFLDPFLLKEMLERADSNQYDFISNVKDRSYPKGMSVEIVRTEYYDKLLPEILNDPYQREHVMPLVYEKAKDAKHFYQINKEYPAAAGLQLALDTALDFERTKWMMQHLDLPHTKLRLKDLLHLYQAYEQSFKR